MKLSQEQAKYFEDLFDLFSTNGWKMITEELNSEIDQFKEVILNIEDEKQFHFIRGQVAVLKRFAQLQTFIEATYKQLEEDEDASV